MIAGDSSGALPSAFAITTVPARTACMRPGTPSCESLLQLERIAELVVEAAHQHVHALQPFHRLQVEPVLAHREVAALHERVPEVAREIGVLEVGLVVRPRREERDERPFRAGRSETRAACSAEWRRSRTAGARGGSGTRRERAGCRADGSRARSPRPKAPACAGTRRTSGRPGRAPDRRRRRAGGSRRRGWRRGRRAGSPGWPYTSAGGRSPSRTSRCAPYRSATMALARRARCSMLAASPVHSDCGRMSGRRSRFQGRSAAFRLGVYVVGDAVLPHAARELGGERVEPVESQRGERADEALPVRAQPPAAVLIGGQLVVVRGCGTVVAQQRGAMVFHFGRLR